jgi:hypothetical protein
MGKSKIKPLEQQSSSGKFLKPKAIYQCAIYQSHAGFI